MYLVYNQDTKTFITTSDWSGFTPVERVPLQYASEEDAIEAITLGKHGPGTFSIFSPHRTFLIERQFIAQEEAE